MKLSLIDVNVPFHSSVIYYLPQQETCSEDKKDKFRIDLYQGTKLIGQKQVHSQLTTHRTEVITQEVCACVIDINLINCNVLVKSDYFPVNFIIQHVDIVFFNFTSVCSD